MPSSYSGYTNGRANTRKKHAGLRSGLPPWVRGHPHSDSDVQSVRLIVSTLPGDYTTASRSENSFCNLRICVDLPAQARESAPAREVRAVPSAGVVHYDRSPVPVVLPGLVLAWAAWLASARHYGI